MTMAGFLKSLFPSPNVAATDSREEPAAPAILSLTLDFSPDTAETAQRNLRALAHRCHHDTRPLLIDLRMATDQTEGARLCYRHALAHLAGPVAILVGANVSRFLGEFLAHTLRSRHATRLFVNEDNARAWLAENV